MAPKRSSEKDGEGKESQPPSGEWTYSKCSNNELLNLVSKVCFRRKVLSIGAPLFVNFFLWKMWTKSSHFTIFLKLGLALPSCSFFRGLLYFYGLELHHLNPNSICHIAIFIHFCEAFLGIEPH
jgi:hypothetical protein